MAKKAGKLRTWEPVVECTHNKLWLVGGWVICAKHCGYVAVCRDCVPSAPEQVLTHLCDKHMQMRQVGKYGVRQEDEHAGDVRDWREKWTAS